MSKGRTPWIIDEWTNRIDLTNQQKYKLRHPDRKRSSRALEQAKAKAAYNALTPEEKRAYHLYKQYKLPWEEYIAELQSQSYKCPLCKTELTPLCAVQDHCHITKKLRSVLCNHCNKVLGLVYEKTETLKNMISYLERYSIV